MGERKELEKRITNWEKAEKLQNNSVVNGLKSCASALIQEIPILGSVLTDAVDKGVELHQEKAKKALINNILEYDGKIKPEDIEGVSFIVEYAKTQEVLVRLANDKKVQYICNLFGNYFLLENHYDDVDLYEEYLEQLSVLSYREIQILMCLDYFERTISHEHIDSDIQRYAKSYGKLKSHAKKQWKIGHKQLEGMMTSISKSGFCKEVTGSYLNYNGGIFYTTAYFQNFLQYIKKRNVSP